MNLERRVWIIAHVLVILMLLVSLRAAYWQLWRGLALDPVALDPVEAAKVYAELRGQPVPGSAETSSLVGLPQPVIQRTMYQLARIQRGKIYDRNGVVLAEDTGTPGDFTRVYAEPSLAHTVGYVSALRTGITGLEATYNRQLLGLDRPDMEIARMLHRPIRGSDLVLTIDVDLQRATVRALGGQPGAAIVLDGKTGAVLAMVSNPGINPNRINDPDYMASLEGSTALLNRATQGLFTPGSTFKTVTLIAALDTNEANMNTVFDYGQPRVGNDGRMYYVYSVDGFDIVDPNHKQDRLNLADSFAYSANAAFAKLADQMPPEVLIDYGQRLGFSTPDYSRRFPLELQVSVPQLANDVDSLRTNNVLRASTGFGQGELLTTPLNLAMVIQSVINDGSIPVPYFVESIRTEEGNIIQIRPSRHLVRGVMSVKTAREVRQIMIGAIDHFQIGQNLVPGAISGGKTGTAQLGGEQDPHGWLMGFSEKDGKVVVICVLQEGATGGSAQALPVYSEIAKAALGIQP
jgi:peptidoglycan glycosyltransferase